MLLFQRPAVPSAGFLFSLHGPAMASAQPIDGSSLCPVSPEDGDFGRLFLIFLC